VDERGDRAHVVNTREGWFVCAANRSLQLATARHVDADCVVERGPAPWQVAGRTCSSVRRGSSRRWRFSSSDCATWSITRAPEPWPHTHPTGIRGALAARAVSVDLDTLLAGDGRVCHGGFRVGSGRVVRMGPVSTMLLGVHRVRGWLASTAEMALVARGVYSYADGALFGVAPWLPCFFFAAGAVASGVLGPRRPHPAAGPDGTGSAPASQPGRVPSKAT
jgi:hypothetical protein